MRCKAKTLSGAPCGGYAVEGSKFCFTHDPLRAAERAVAHRRGGNNHPHLTNETPFPECDVKTAAGLCRFLESLLKETWLIEQSLSRSRTLAYVAMVQKGVIEVGELEARLQKLEEVVAAEAHK